MARDHLNEVENRIEIDMMRSLENTTDIGANDPLANNDLENEAEDSHDRKQLVFLAGPQQTGMKAVQQFFVHHASEYRHLQHAEGLAGWYWPMVEPSDLPEEYASMEHHELFDLLLHGHGHDKVFHILMSAIRNAWHSSEHGIIFGSELFDRYGQGHQRAFAIMERIVEHLHIKHPQNQVSVVLNYPSPRLNHLKRFIEDDAMQTSASFFDYKSWVCQEDEIAKRYELLDTSMNPMDLARTARHFEWSVFVLDMAGIAEDQQDPAHVIGCRVLRNTACEDGVIKGLEGKIINNLPEGLAFFNGKQDMSEEASMSAFQTLSGLSASETMDLETMLAERDCAYRAEFMHDDPGFRVLHKAKLWETCSESDEAIARYEHLSNTTTLLYRVQDQMECADTLFVPVAESSSTKGEKDQAVSGGKSAVYVTVAILVAFVLWFLRAVRQRRRELASEHKTQQLHDAESGIKSLENISPSSTSTASSSSSTSSPVFGFGQVGGKSPSKKNYNLSYRLSNEARQTSFQKEMNLSPRKDTELYLEEKRRGSAFQYDNTSTQETLKIVEEQLDEIDLALTANTGRTFSHTRVSPRNNIGDIA